MGTEALLSSSKLKVDESTASTALGRGLAVKESIPAGSSLLNLKPVISVLNPSYLDKTCSTCFITSKQQDPLYGKKLLACNGCHLLRYCSKAEDWKAHHRKECKLLQRQKEPLGALAHGVLRLWNLDSSGAENDPVVRDVSKLESHRQDFQQNSEWWQDIMEAVNDIRTLSTLAGKYIDQSSGGRIALLACKFAINSFALGHATAEINSHTLGDVTSESIGRIFDPTLALLNHSCVPNAALVYNGAMVDLRSIRDIQSGEQVTISYIDNTNIRPARQGQTLMNYFFRCGCPACNPPSLQFTGRDSYVCDGPSCKSLITTPALSNKFSCPTCRKPQSMTLRQLQSLELNALGVLDKNLLAKDNLGRLLTSTLLPALSTLTSCPAWPAVRQPAPALRKLIVQIAESTANFALGYEHSKALSSPPLIDLHPEPCHPWRATQMYRTGTLLAILGTMQSDEEYLSQAKEMLAMARELGKKSHGVESDFLKKVEERIRDVNNDWRREDFDGGAR